MPKTFVLKKHVFIPRPVRDVFAFFETPENLSLLTPPKLGFQIITPSPILMKKDAVIDYTIKVLGLRLGWRTLITDYQAGRMFVDEQVKGPYKYWQHTHSFIEFSDGTLVTDEVRYALPFGFLGQLAHALFVRSQLNNIFEYRARIIQSKFESPNRIEKTKLVYSNLREAR